MTNTGRMAVVPGTGRHEARTEEGRDFERSGFERAQTSEKQRPCMTDRVYDAYALPCVCGSGGLARLIQKQETKTARKDKLSESFFI